MTTALTPAERQELQALLQARRDSLVAQREAHLAGQTRAEHAREVLLQDGDDANQRDADREVDLALADREVVDLAALDAALQRLSQGQYGQCTDCGEDIPVARLRLAPQSLRCVDCAARTERGQPRPASM